MSVQVVRAPVALDPDTEEPTTLHDLARIMLSCVDIPIAPEWVEEVAVDGSHL